MAAGETIKGEDGVIKIGGSTEIAMLQSWEFSSQADVQTLDTRVMKSNADGGSAAAGGYAKKTAGNKSATFTATHQWQKNDAAGAAALLRTNDVGTTVTFELFPHLITSGNRKVSGNAIIASVGVASEVNGVVTQTTAYEVDGEWADAEIA